MRLHKHTADHDPPRGKLSMLSPLVTALVLAAASCIAHALMTPEYGRVFAGVLVGALGGVYLGGALRAGTRVEIAVATVAAVVFISIGVGGLLAHGSAGAWIIPVGFLLHGVWDWIHHALERPTVGRWWPPFCAAYDGVVGVYLLWAR